MSISTSIPKSTISFTPSNDNRVSSPMNSSSWHGSLSRQNTTSKRNSSGSSKKPKRSKSPEMNSNTESSSSISSSPSSNGNIPKIIIKPFTPRQSGKNMSKSTPKVGSGSTDSKKKKPGHSTAKSRVLKKSKNPIVPENPAPESSNPKNSEPLKLSLKHASETSVSKRAAKRRKLSKQINGEGKVSPSPTNKSSQTTALSISSSGSKRGKYKKAATPKSTASSDHSKTFSEASSSPTSSASPITPVNGSIISTPQDSASPKPVTKITLRFTPKSAPEKPSPTPNKSQSRKVKDPKESSKSAKKTSTPKETHQYPENDEQDQSGPEDEEGWTFPDNPQKNKKFFRIGPSFKRTCQNFSIVDSQNQQIFAILACRIDRGFHFTNEGWLTYRRNYITFSSAFSLTTSSAIEYGKIPKCNLYIDTGNDTRLLIKYFSLRITAFQSLPNGKLEEVLLIQHTPKRNKGLKRAPAMIPVVPGLLPSHDYIKNNTTFRTSTRKKEVESHISYPKNALGSFAQHYPDDTISYVALFERIQITTPTGGDYQKCKAVIQLVATVESGACYVAAWSETPYFTLRIRSPSSYGDGVLLVNRKVTTNTPRQAAPRGKNFDKISLFILLFLI